LPTETTASLDALLALLRASLGLGPLPQAIDEAPVLAAAAAHRVEGLLGRPAGRPALAALSEAAQEKLRAAHRRVLLDNMLRLSVLRRAAAACASEGLTLAPLKGAWLILRLYRDPGARAMVDLDVLVPARRFHRACRAMRAAGFVVPDPVPLDRFPIRFFYDHHFVHPEMPASWVEVHRYLCYRAFAAPDYVKLLARAEPFEEGGAPLRALRPEDTLLHLAIHQAKHGFRIVLRDTVDVAALARSGVDWDDLVAHARAAGASASLWAALESAAGALSAPVPPDVLSRLDPGAGRRARLAGLIDLERGTGLREGASADEALLAVVDHPARARWWRFTQRVVRAGDRVRARVARRG
jgi:hypothetical protein